MSLSSAEHLIYSTRFSKRIFWKPLALSVIALVMAFLSKSIAAEYAH